MNSLINIFGLAIGLASFILISLYVNYELNWDTYNENHERIYLLNQVRNYSGTDEFFEQVPGGLALGLKEQIPEIEKSACIYEIWGEVLSSSKDKSIFEPAGFYADNSIFDLLTFEFIAGDPANALTNPNSIVFTESMALKHFGNCDVLGKIIKTDNRAYSISAVISDMPFNSRFRASYFVPLSVYNEKYAADIYSDWENSWTRVFIQLKNPEHINLVSKKAAEIINEHVSDPEKKCSVYLMPLSKAHLGHKENGFFYIIVIYSILGFLILILSAINFINLSTAQSSIRTKEIGVKKVFGSVRSMLTGQFLAESVLNALLALILAFGIAEFFLPSFSTITDRILIIDYIGDWRFILFVVISTITLGFIAGLYPAFYLSKFNPITVLKSGTTTSERSKIFSFKKVLIAFQFIISIAFIIGTIGFFANANYIKTKDVGFDTDGLLFTTLRSSENAKFKNIEDLRNELKQNTEIENVSISTHVPFNGEANSFLTWEGAQENERIKTVINKGGDHFFPTYEIPIIKGRNLSNNLASDSSACVVNEEFIRKVGWDDPIGKKIDDGKYTIVGVVKDFHIMSPISQIDPYMLKLHNGGLNNYKILSFRLKDGYSDNTIIFIRDKLQEIFPDNYFELKFTADIMGGAAIGLDFNKILNNVAKTMMSFTGIAILIALVGLFSLVSFSIKRKVKEIGIRKIMGASVSNIYFFISKEFLVLLIISNIIAIPLGIMLLKAIPFSYRPDFNVIPIIVVVISSFIVTLVSISYWVLKTARANPVDSLRYE